MAPRRVKVIGRAAPCGVDGGKPED